MIGTDPEAFFVDSSMVLPAQVVFDEIMEGDNRISYPQGDLCVDGAALEFQPYPGSPKQVVDNLYELLIEAQVIATKFGTEVAIEPELPIDLGWCETDPSLGVFGCDPDLSVWGEGCRPETIDASRHPYRYAGCHVHISTGDPLFFRRNHNIETVTKALDRTVGLAAMVISDNCDERRRGIYGRPGVCRHQPWGMEYRTPSNCILRSPRYMRFIFRLTAKTLFLANTSIFEEVIPDDLVVGTLRGNDVKLAKDLYDRLAVVADLPPIPSPELGRWQDLWRI